MKKLFALLGFLIVMLFAAPVAKADWTFYVDVSNTGWTSSPHLHIGNNNGWYTNMTGTLVSDNLYKFDISGWTDLKRIAFTKDNGNSDPGSDETKKYGNFTTDSGSANGKVFDGAVYVLNESPNGATIVKKWWGFHGAWNKWRSLYFIPTGVANVYSCRFTPSSNSQQEFGVRKCEYGEQKAWYQNATFTSSNLNSYQTLSTDGSNAKYTLTKDKEYEAILDVSNESSPKLKIVEYVPATYSITGYAISKDGGKSWTDLNADTKSVTLSDLTSSNSYKIKVSYENTADASDTRDDVYGGSTSSLTKDGDAFTIADNITSATFTLSVNTDGVPTFVTLSNQTYAVYTIENIYLRNCKDGLVTASPFTASGNDYVLENFKPNGTASNNDANRYLFEVVYSNGTVKQFSKKSTNYWLGVTSYEAVEDVTSNNNGGTQSKWIVFKSDFASDNVNITLHITPASGSNSYPIVSSFDFAKYVPTAVDYTFCYDNSATNWSSVSVKIGNDTYAMTNNAGTWTLTKSLTEAPSTVAFTNGTVTTNTAAFVDNQTYKGTPYTITYNNGGTAWSNVYMNAKLTSDASDYMYSWIKMTKPSSVRSRVAADRSDNYTGSFVALSAPAKICFANNNSGNNVDDYTFSGTTYGQDQQPKIAFGENCHLWVTGLNNTWDYNTDLEFNWDADNQLYYYEIEGGKLFRISTMKGGDNWGSFNGNSYGVGDYGEETVLSTSASTPTALTKGKQGNLKTPSGGTYIVYVDPYAAAAWAVEGSSNLPVANMPLKKSAFVADGSSVAHYFLVGNRMGDFHLQPEWELQPDGNGNYVLNNRIMYPGLIGIAKVDNYDDYINQRFEYFSKPVPAVYVGQNHMTGLQSYGKKSGYQDYNNLYYTENVDDKDRFYYSGTKPFNVDNSAFFSRQCEHVGWDIQQFIAEEEGIFVKNITLSTNNGNPQNVVFTFADENSATDKALAANERVFQLVGSKITNKNLSTLAPGKTTPLEDNGYWAQNGGWEQAWIQYDSEGKPYYDARGNFIYQTVYQSSWFAKHPSYFYDDKQFVSDNLTFVAADKLKNLSEDPYKEFYKVHTATKKIGDNQELSGKGFNYKENLVDYTENSITPGSDKDWTCYVMREVYIDGQFKIWSGMGGGSHLTEETQQYTDEGNFVKKKTSGDKNPRWNYLNGGPRTRSVDDQNIRTIQPFDITSGGEADLYMMKQDENINFMVDQRTFFKRIIVWYNEKFDTSVIQFIKESAGPEISAETVSGSNKSLRYTWTVTDFGAHQGDAIKGYSISRYRQTNTGVVLDQVVENYTTATTIGALINSTNTSITQTDNGKGDINPSINPGTYFYEMTITFADGTKKTAESNRVTLYNAVANQYYPDLVPVQLLELTDAGKALLVSDNPSLQQTDFQYLTHRQEDDANYYAIKVNSDGSFVVKDVNNDKAKELINNIGQTDKDGNLVLNNDGDPIIYYYWTAKYFVAIYDKTAFANKMQENIDNGFMTSYVAPTEENIELYMNANKDDEDYSTNLSTKVKPATGDINYAAALIDREGWLNKSAFKAVLNYTVDGNARNPQTSSDILPVVPMPYNMWTEYLAPAQAGSAIMEGQVFQNIGSSVTGCTAVNDVTFPILDKSDEQEEESVPVLSRQLHCVFHFNRPNVSRQILNNYNIHYTITLSNENEVISSDEYVDDTKDYAVGADLTKSYALHVHDVNPNSDVNPTLVISATVYNANQDEGTYAGTQLEASHGLEITASAPSAIIGRDISMDGLRLEYYPCNNGTGDARRWGWVVKGLSSFDDYGDNFGEEDVEHIVIPSYYHIETYTKVGEEGGDVLYDNYYSYPYLVRKGEFEGKEIVYDFKGSVKAKYNGETVDRPYYPHVVITPVYIFQRNPQMSAHFDNGLHSVKEANNAPRRRAAGDEETEFVVARGKHLDYSVADYASLGSTVTGVSDVTVDADVDAVYYTIQGIQLPAGSKLAPGVYIERRGNTARKVLIK